MLDESTLLGKVVTAAILGLLSFMCWGTYQLSVQQAVIANDVQGLKELVVQMQNNYITRAEAEIKFDHLEQELMRMRDTVRSLVLSMEDDEQ